MEEPSTSPTKSVLIPLGLGAGDGNRTRVASLGSWNSAVELHLHIWRREWDSNPRMLLHTAGFQDRFLKPLGHLSVKRFYRFRYE